MNTSFLSPVSYPTLSSVPLTLWHIHSLPEPKKGYNAAVPYICPCTGTDNANVRSLRACLLGFKMYSVA